MKAIWRGIVIAESNYVEKIDGDIYFPPYAMKKKYFSDSSKKTKNISIGEAQYFHITVNGVVNQDSAWIYKDPMNDYKQIKNYIAFWRGVKIEE